LHVIERADLISAAPVKVRLLEVGPDPEEPQADQAV
jgi:hypothetical protein